MVNIKEVGMRVREQRRGIPLRREDVASKANVALSTIDLLEQGHRLPKIQTLDKIAEVLGVSLSDLLAARRRPVAA